MRAALIGFLALTTLAANAAADEDYSGRNLMAPLCRDGQDERLRLSSVPVAEAEALCTVASDGALYACWVTAAEPNNSAVRFFALQRLCGQRLETVDDLPKSTDGEPLAAINARFSIECERARGAQVCYTGAPHAPADAAQNSTQARAEPDTPTDLQGAGPASLQR